jgi:hypothetical protein
VTAVPRLLATVLGVVLTAGLAACDADTASTPVAAPTSSAATSSPMSDAKSSALCSALITVVGSGTAWQLDPPTPASRVVAGVVVPACEGVSDAGTRLTAAYLPTAGGLAGPQLLAALCQAVVGVEPSAGARSCSAPRQGRVEQGTEGRRADLAAGDGGVLVLSFGSNRPEYVASAVKDLATVGQGLARDSLLARAVA